MAIFPADTVYGLACDPENSAAVEHLYQLKGRPLSKPSAVMFFNLQAALEALPELGPRTRQVALRLLPGAVTLLIPNLRRRFELACGEHSDLLGLRVPDVPRLAKVSRPVLQSSANLAGGPDPRRVQDVPQTIRSAVELVIDGGELSGTPSTVIDLRSYETGHLWSIVRPGAVGVEQVAAAL